MIECICINDLGRPSRIPPHKWVEKGKKYHIEFATFVLPQRTLGVQLLEITLDESCSPFDYFLGSRFVIKDKDMHKLVALIEETTQIQTSIEELKKQTSHVEIHS